MHHRPAQDPVMSSTTIKALAPLACLGLALWLGLTSTGHAQAQLMSAPMEVRSAGPMSLRVFAVNWELDGPLAMRQIRFHVYNQGPETLEATLLVPLESREQFQGFALETQGQWVDATPVKGLSSDVTQVPGTLGGTTSQANTADGKHHRVRLPSIPAQGFRSVQITVTSSAQEASCGWMHPLVLPQGDYHGFTLSVHARSELPPSGHATWRPVGTASGVSERTWRLWARTSTQVPKTVCLKSTPPDAQPAPAAPKESVVGRGSSQP
jgi:hypothetical protein